MWTGGSRFDEFNMAIKINRKLTAKKLVPKLERFFDLSGRKILAIEKSWMCDARVKSWLSMRSVSGR